MRRTRFVAIGALVFVGLVPSARAQERHQVTDEDVLLEDVAPGWSPVPCPEIEGMGASACFAPDAGPPRDLLILSASPIPEGVDPGVLVEVAAAGIGGEPFETPGLVIAAGRVMPLAGQTLATLAMVAGDHVFHLNLLSSAPREDTVVLLLDMARRQQDAAGPPVDVAGSDAGIFDQLDPLLLTPPEGSGLEVMLTVDAPLDVTELRPVARSQEVVDLLASAPGRMRILSANGVPVVFVTLEEQPYGAFAATELGALGELMTGRRLDLGSGAPPDAVGFRMPVEGGNAVGVAFRKGRYFALVVAPPLGLDEQAMLDEVRGLARLQADLLPEGDTAPYLFPPTARSIAVTVLITSAICGVAVGAGRLAAARGRRRGRGARPSSARTQLAPPPSPRVTDVTRDAATLRRRGALLLLVDLVAVDLIVVGTLGLTGVLRLPAPLTLGLLAVGAVGGIAFTAWWARSEVQATPDEAFAPGVRPSVAATLGGVAALAALVVGLALIAAGVASLAFGPSLSDLERSQRYDVNPTTVSSVALLGGVILLVVGGFAVRLARMWARTSARRLRDRDRRPPVLYLRSFEDDALRLPAVVSARRPFLELFAARGSDPFEESIAWQVAPYGPVVAIGRPGRSLRTLGAARDHLPDDVWREGVTERMGVARAIVVTIGATDGLRWELAQLIAAGRLERTVFVLPPVSADVLRDRWSFTAGALTAAGAQVADLPVATERTLAIMLDGSGPWLATADVRDEATFRIALDRAMDRLTAGGGPGPPPTVPSRPDGRGS